MGNGTLIIMAGTMQQFWKAPGRKPLENVGERINLTFRKILKRSRKSIQVTLIGEVQEPFAKRPAPQ